MVKFRPAAEIWTFLPDDSIEEGDYCVQFAGRGVSEAIAEHLRGAGYTVSTPEHMGEQGWDFKVNAKPRSIFIQITYFGNEYLLISYESRWFAYRRKYDNPVHAEILDRINNLLNADPRFHRVRWFFDEEIHGGGPGAASPFGDAA